MKKIFFPFIFLAIIYSCKESEGSNPDKPFNIEGDWYISGRTGIYGFENDSTSFTFDEDILGYEEHTFSLIKGEENEYSVSSKMKYIFQKEGESDNDFIERIENGQYSKDELIVSSFNSPSWIISKNDIYIPGEFISNIPEKERYHVAKIVKHTNNMFVIASVCPTIWSIFIDENSQFKYYTTFRKIR